MKILVLQAPGDHGEGLVAEDGSMVEGSGRDLVEEMVRSFAPIPEALLLTGGRPGFEMMCGQGTRSQKSSLLWLI